MNSWHNILSLCCIAVSLFYSFGTSLHVAAVTDINGCSNATLQSCAPEASCVNITGTFNCSCNGGYIGDGFNCTDINECDVNQHNCSPQASCMNVVGGFNCSCKAGYIGDGVNCTDLNECTNSLHNCSVYAKCHNFDSGFNCSCMEGFTGDGVTCADINECDVNQHNCSPQASCMNVVGGFNCSCKAGYIGDGVNCTDVDECSNNSLNNCSQNANCRNFGGGYNCSCKSGFAGDGIMCKDVDECFQMYYPCSEMAICKNTIGKFDCICTEGYGGNGSYCIDIDECTDRTHKCSEFAKCTNNVGGYNCDCNDGFVGNGFNCLEKPMVDYKTEVQVQQNKLYGPYFVDLKITAFDRIYQNIYVSANGYIAFGEKSYAQPGDGTFPEASPILAPFWTAFDVAAPGKIFIDSYEYCKDKKLLNRIGNMVPPTFHAKRAVVVTWQNLSPYPASEFGNESITFQSILVSNGTLFYAIFNYDKDDVKLNAEANRNIVVGYGNGNNGSVLFARDKEFFNLLKTGNEVYGLRKTFKIGNRTESSLNCLEWHCENEEQFKIDSFAIPCPCTLQQAKVDLTFKGLTINACYENRFTINGTKQRCCYSSVENALLKNYPDGGFIYKINGSFADGENYCCRDYPLCNIFYDIHPSDTCSKYKVPETVFVLDPLVFKMINKKWNTFYGAGEYTLLTVKAPGFDTSVTIQVRVEMKDNDQFSKIPVYTAFAIKSGNAVLEINEEGNAMIKNNTDNTFEKENNTIFFNNMHLEIISVNDSMGIILTLPHYLVQPYLLSGLLTGKMPNGQAIDPSSNSDVYKMWEACRVKEEDSLLNYTHKNYSSFNSYNISEIQFIEILSNLSNLINSTETKCQDSDMFCICAAVLQKINLANHTMLYKPDYFETIENFPPFIQNAMDELYLTSGNNTIPLKAVDRNNDSIVIEIEVNNVKKTFDSSNLNWTLNLDVIPKDLKVWAKDSRGATSLYWPDIFFCKCKGNGNCKKQSKSERMVSAKNRKRFYGLRCTCDEGYTGENCKAMIDMCTTKPCYHGVSCNSSLGEKDMCGSCPTGLSGNGRVCYDKDFCSKGVCSQKCKDNIGDTYVCSCKNGYKLAADNKTCEDINECTMPSKCSGFGQYCFNVLGSFQCKCKTGYVSDNGTCEVLANKNKFSGFMSINLRGITQTQMAEKLADKSSEEYKTTSEGMKKSILDKIGKNNVVVIDDIVTNQSNRTKRSTDQNSLKVLYTIYGDAIKQADLENMLKKGCSADCCKFNGLCVAPASLQLNVQDMCKEIICDSMTTNCTAEEKGFRCNCKPGFDHSPQYGLFTCKDIDECNTIQPCGSIPCTNTFGGYKCLCESGHVFKNESKSCVDVCAGHRCQNGDCIKLEESYQCRCHDYWTDKYCDKKLEEEESFRTAAIVIGVVLGILCLLLIVVIVYIIRKYKKPSYNGNNLIESAKLERSIKVDDSNIGMSSTKSSSNIYSNRGMDNQSYEPDV